MYRGDRVRRCGPGWIQPAFAAIAAVGGLDDLGGGQAVLLEQGVGCAALAELVAEVDVADRHRLELGDGHGHHAAQAAVGQVLLGDDQGAGLLGGGRERVAVDRLDRVHVEHAGLDALAGQGLGRVERRGDHQAVGDRASRRFPSRSWFALPIGERGRAVGVDLGHLGTADAEVDRALVVEHRPGRRLGRLLVGRDDARRSPAASRPGPRPRSPSARRRPRRSRSRRGCRRP